MEDESIRSSSPSLENESMRSLSLSSEDDSYRPTSPLSTRKIALSILNNILFKQFTSSAVEEITDFMRSDVTYCEKTVVFLLPLDMMPRATVRHAAGSRVHWITISELAMYHANFATWKSQMKRMLDVIHGMMEVAVGDSKLIICCLDPFLINGIILTFLTVFFNYNYRAAEAHFCEYLENTNGSDIYSLPSDFKDYIMPEYINNSFSTDSD